MCRFIETIRIENGRLQHIEAHQQRLNATREKHFPAASNAIDLKQVLKPESFQARTRCRVEYGADILKVEYIPYSIRPIKLLRCVESNTIEYAYKKADRSEIDELFNQKGDADEVLIIRNGLLSDTSICNIALSNGKEWYTPAYPLLQGTMREQLLCDKRIIPATIWFTDLRKYQKIRLFNAMIDFGELELPVSAIITG